MTSAPTNPPEVPPYQMQPLISSFMNDIDPSGASTVQIRCAQASGSEIYVGCSNGELLRYALQADDPEKLEVYSLLSRQKLPHDKPIDEIVLLPSIYRALVFSDRQIIFYTLPTLDPIPTIKPLRNVITFAVDDQHLRRPAPSLSDPASSREPVEFCVMKRSNIALYSLLDRLYFQKEVPLPDGATLARRTGYSLCVADKEFYNVINLETASFLPRLPVSQVPDTPAKPSITVIGPSEFLILSWTGEGTIGVFMTGEGDPVRGTLEWPTHPEAVCYDYPYITALLPNGTVEIHSIETQAIVQVLSPPPPLSPSSSSIQIQLAQRTNLSASSNGFLVPSGQRSDKMRMKSVPLLRDSAAAV